MPFYEYECSNCKFYVEALQKITDEPLRQCPSCKKKTLKKLVSAPVFRLKGGGWYETDFKSEQEEKRNLADREEAPEAKTEEAKPEADKAESKEDKKVESKSDAKPAVKAAKPAVKPPAKAKAPVRSAAKAKAPAKSKPKVKPAAKKKRR